MTSPADPPIAFGAALQRLADGRDLTAGRPPTFSLSWSVADWTTCRWPHC
jgi:hypothetical protein